MLLEYVMPAGKQLLIIASSFSGFSSPTLSDLEDELNWI
jgi:hypothetical protein